MMRKLLIILVLFSGSLFASDERNNGCLFGSPEFSPENLIHDFQLVNANDPARYLVTAPPFATGDCRIRKDSGVWANCTNLPNWDGEGGATVTLTPTEQTAAKIKLKLVDQSDPPLWLATAKIITTGGAQGSMFASQTAPVCP